MLERPKGQGDLVIRKNGANYLLEVDGFNFEEFGGVLADRIQAHIWEFMGLAQQKDGPKIAQLLKRILEEG